MLVFLEKVLKIKPFKKPSLEDSKIFLRNDKPVTGNMVREAHESTCKKAEIDDFHFHDFRHTAINNWRKQGHDYFKIMAASGHRTISVFKRYSMVDEGELRTLVDLKENRNMAETSPISGEHTNRALGVKSI